MQSLLPAQARVAGRVIIRGFVRKPNDCVRYFRAVEEGSKHGRYARASSTCIDTSIQCANILPLRIRTNLCDLLMANYTN